MKIVLLKEKIKKGLSIVEKIIERNLNLPILNNVLISTEKNFLTLNTTNLEMAIKHWFLVKTEKEGEITVPAKFLSSFISFLPAEKITIETKDNSLFIYYNENITQIKGQTPEDFPITPEIKTKSFIELNSSRLCHALSRVVNFTAPTQTRPEISGVCFNFQGNKLLLAATDSFRLAERVVFFEKNTANSQEYSFILPTKSAKEVINIFSEEKNSVKIYFSPNQIAFENLISEVSHPRTQLISRLIEGDYPNYQEMILKKYEKCETKVVVTKEDFLNQLRMTSLFSGKTNEVHMKILSKKGMIEIFSSNPEIGENKSVIFGKINGKDAGVSFNPRFLIDGLLNIESQEIIFELNGDEGPAIMKPVGEQNYLYMVMPIKTG